MNIGDICIRETSVVSQDTSIEQAAGIMRDSHVGDVVVIEDRDGLRVPVGILTDRDLVVELLAKRVDAGSVRVGDVMSAEIIVAREDDDLYDTIQTMRARGVRRIPVVAKDGSLAGIVSTDDLLDAITETLQALTRITSRQQARERILRT